MSNIPKARALIEDVLTEGTIDTQSRVALYEALSHMTRKNPEFIARRHNAPLSIEQKVQARRMRNEGAAMNYIAQLLGTNIGRVSEACAE